MFQMVNLIDKIDFCFDLNKKLTGICDVVFGSKLGQ